MTDDFFLLAALVLFSIALLLWLLDRAAGVWIDREYARDARKAAYDAACFKRMEDERDTGQSFDQAYIDKLMVNYLRQMGRDARGYLIKGKRA